MPLLEPGDAAAAWRALVRHAVMTEEFEAGRTRPVLVSRRRSAALTMPEISAESRAQYECEFAERVGIMMDGGVPEEEAEQAALMELGCLEFWDFINDSEIEAGRKVAA
jgi:hypothetical protein